MKMNSGLQRTHALALMAGILSSLVTLQTASANTETFTTSIGATTSGGSVDAQAVFTFSLNTISITLDNFESDPTDVAQGLSALLFTVSPAETSGTLTSSSGIPRSIDKNGVYSDSAAIPTGWILSNSGGTFNLDDLGGAGPSNLVLGSFGASNTYDNANGSIAGNKPHNPFLADSATFTLTINGVTESSSVSSVKFQFGTTDGHDRVCAVPTPEPAPLAMLAIGLISFGGFQWSRRQRTA
jgi:hypothetical protein